MRRRLVSLAFVLTCLTYASSAQGSVITLSGTITQDTQDVGSPAVANPSLNSVLDGDAFTIILNITGNLVPVGGFVTTSQSFSDISASAVEAAFVSGSVNVFSSGGLSQFSVIGCLIDISSCAMGNQLALEFQIPTPLLTSGAASVQGIPALLPVDLLEDGGATDIQGTLTSYSYSGASLITPEPSSWLLLTLGFTSLSLLNKNLTKRKNNHVC